MDLSNTTIDDYISGYPKEIQKLLNQMRKTIKEAAPNAEEVIKYGMPTFVLAGNLVHFAAAKHHIGFYPTPSGIVAFEKKLAKYKSSKGAVQFPLDQPLPLTVVAEITKFRVKENLEKASLKRAKAK